MRAIFLLLILISTTWPTAVHADSSAFYQDFSPYGMPKNDPNYREAELAIGEGDTPEEALQALLTIVQKKSPAALRGIADAQALALYPQSEQSKIRQVLDRFGIATSEKSERIFKTVDPADLELVSRIQGKPTLTERSPADEGSNKAKKEDPLAGYDKDFKNQKINSQELSKIDQQIEKLDFGQMSLAEHDATEQLANHLFNHAIDKGNFRYKFTMARFGLSLLGSSISLATSGYSKISSVTMGSLSAFMSGFIQWHTKRFFQLVSEHRLRVELRNIPISLRNMLAQKYANLRGKKDITLLDLIEIPVDAEGRVVKSSGGAKLAKWGLTEVGINAVTSIGRPLVLAALFTGEMVWNGMGYTLPEEMRLSPVIRDIGLMTGITMLTQGYWETVLEKIYNTASDYYKFAAAVYTIQLQKMVTAGAKAEEILMIRILRNRAIERSIHSFKLLSYGMLVGSLSWVIAASTLGQPFIIKYAPLFVLAVGAKVISILKNPKVDLNNSPRLTPGEKVRADIDGLKNVPMTMAEFFRKFGNALCEKTVKRKRNRRDPPDSDLLLPDQVGGTP